MDIDEDIDNKEEKDAKFELKNKINKGKKSIIDTNNFKDKLMKELEGKNENIISSKIEEKYKMYKEYELINSVKLSNILINI